MRWRSHFLTLLQVHVVHFGVLDLLQLLAELLCDLLALVVRLDFLLGARYTEANAAAYHNHCGNDSIKLCPDRSYSYDVLTY